MSYQAIVQSDRRLTILILLAQSAGYSANEHLLRAALDGFGHSVARDLLRTELAWLKEQGLVMIEEIAGMQVAELTARGADVQAGRAHVPGIKRPEAG